MRSLFVNIWFVYLKSEGHANISNLCFSKLKTIFVMIIALLRTPKHICLRIEVKHELFIERHLPIWYGRSEYQFPISYFWEASTTKVLLWNTRTNLFKSLHLNISYLDTKRNKGDNLNIKLIFLFLDHAYFVFLIS